MIQREALNCFHRKSFSSFIAPVGSTVVWHNRADLNSLSSAMQRAVLHRIRQHQQDEVHLDVATRGLRSSVSDDGNVDSPARHSPSRNLKERDGDGIRSPPRDKEKSSGPPSALQTNVVIAAAMLLLLNFSTILLFYQSGLQSRSGAASSADIRLRSAMQEERMEALAATKAKAGING